VMGNEVVSEGCLNYQYIESRRTTAMQAAAAPKVSTIQVGPSR
jgi:hypothetical protein